MSESKTLRQQLAREPAPSCSQRDPERDFFFPHRGTRQQQVGGVSAGDQQHGNHASKKHQQQRPRIADKDLLIRREGYIIELRVSFFVSWNESWQRSLGLL